MCEGWRGLVETPDPPVFPVGAGSELLCPHSGTSSTGESAKSEHYRGSELIKGISHQGADACTTKAQKCNAQGTIKASTETRGVSTSGGTCTWLSPRVLVDVQDLSSPVATQPARVLVSVTAVESVSFDDWFACHGLDEDTDTTNNNRPKTTNIYNIMKYEIRPNNTV
eukprot:6466588-Amphidinium_carterae.3